MTENDRFDPALMGYDLLPALDEAGCPICRVSTQALDRFYFFFLYEGYHAQEVIEALQTSFGLCPRHTRPILARPEAKVEASAIAEFLLAGTLRRLDAALELLRDLPQDGWQGRRRRQASLERARASLRPGQPCLACEQIARTVNINIGWLLDGLRDPEIRRLFQRSDGLCMPRFCQAVGRCQDPEVLRVLLEDQQVRLQVLEALCADFLHKADYRFHHEPKGQEQVAWLMATERYAGTRIRKAPAGRAARGSAAASAV